MCGLCGRSWRKASFLWSSWFRVSREYEGRKKKQSAMVLSRGKFAFRVNSGVSEKGRNKPGLYGGHLKCVVGLSSIRQHRLVPCMEICGEKVPASGSLMKSHKGEVPHCCIAVGAAGIKQGSSVCMRKLYHRLFGRG